MTSTTHSEKRERDISPHILEYILSKGLCLVYKICSKFDCARNSGFGIIHSREEYLFGWGAFGEHMRSARHQRNVDKKIAWLAENERRKNEQFPSKKRTKQSVLSFATKIPSPTQVHERMKGDIPLDLACGENKNVQKLTTVDQQRTYYMVNELKEENDTSLHASSR